MVRRMLQVQVNLKSRGKRDIFFGMSDLLTISEVSRRSGVAASALRRIAFIVFAQRIGLTLKEIGAELAKLPEDRVPEGKDWAKLSGRWTGRIDERIAELQRLRAGLTGCIGCGCLSLDRCQFANPGDRAARRGAGPVYWVGDQHH